MSSTKLPANDTKLVRRLRVTFGTEASRLAGFTLSVSAQGMTLQAPARAVLEPGSSLSGTIVLGPNDAVVPFTGTVRRSHRPEGVLAGAVNGVMEIAFDRATATAYYSYLQRGVMQANTKVGATTAPPAAPSTPPSTRPATPPTPPPAARTTGTARISAIPRAHARFDAKLAAEYELFSGAKRIHPAECYEIGEGGAGVRTGVRVEAVSTRLFLSMHLPRGGQVRLLAHVVWSRPARLGSSGEILAPATMGVRFEPGQALPEAYRALILEQEEAQKPAARTSELDTRTGEDRERFGVTRLQDGPELLPDFQSFTDSGKFTR